MMGQQTFRSLIRSSSVSQYLKNFHLRIATVNNQINNYNISGGEAAKAAMLERIISSSIESASDGIVIINLIVNGCNSKIKTF